MNETIDHIFGELATCERNFKNIDRNFETFMKANNVHNRTINLLGFVCIGLAVGGLLQCNNVLKLHKKIDKLEQRVDELTEPEGE